MYELNCVIFSHKFDKDGKLINAWATHFLGSLAQLQETIAEMNKDCKRHQERGHGYVIPIQIIPKQ